MFQFHIASSVTPIFPLESEQMKISQTVFPIRGQQRIVHLWPHGKCGTNVFGCDLSGFLEVRRHRSSGRILTESGQAGGERVFDVRGGGPDDHDGVLLKRRARGGRGRELRRDGWPRPP